MIEFKNDSVIKSAGSFMKKNDRMKALRYLSLLSQFGFSVAMPPLLCIFAALFIQKKFGTGDWIIITAIITGLISSGCTFFNFIKVHIKKESGDQDEQNGPGSKKGND